MFDINKKKHKSRNIKRITLIRKKITRGRSKMAKRRKAKKKGKKKAKKRRRR
jgi:hypothetical protein